MTNLAVSLAQLHECQEQREALRRVLHKQVEHAAGEIVRLEGKLHELHRAAREVVKWRGSPDTPWRTAVDNLAALLPDDKEMTADGLQEQRPLPEQSGG